ncbi:AbrB/MazE/SpoVT family DNA-binding domain-containing protein [bacterium]|nr:AbrB/MazE/SpoVT family DNA-binding domain-containing protein [bacterium]
MSSKHQIVIPKEVRQALKLQPGDHLLCRIEGDEILLRPKPKSYTKYLRGLHKNVWKDVDTAEYIKQERKSWDK